MYFLSDLMISLLKFIALDLHFGYLGSLILMSLFLKILFIPEQISSYKNRIKKREIRDEIRKIQDRKFKTSNWARRKVLNKRKKDLYKEKQILPRTQRMLIIIFEFFVIIEFLHMCRMIGNIKGDLQYMWFDLTKKDNTLLLPFMVLFVNLVDGYPKEEGNKILSFIIYATFNLLIFYFSMHLPSSVLVYWIIGSLVSIPINLLLYTKIPPHKNVNRSKSKVLISE
jgi:YidC/Oxa1 family membrane protein insertase